MREEEEGEIRGEVREGRSEGGEGRWEEGEVGKCKGGVKERRAGMRGRRRKTGETKEEKRVDRRQLLGGEGGEAPTCDEGHTKADKEEHLQQEVAIVVNYYSCNYGNDSQTKVLDGLHAVKREGRGEEGKKERRGGGCGE